MPARSEWSALAAIAGVFLAGCALVGPLRDAPVIDDWVYAWSVEHLLKTGELRVLDITSIYPLFQILWGALFARLGGFSFGTLRISTVVLAALGPCALYLTFRELAFGRTVSLLGALALALHPVYFAMSFSFMTDAAFVSMSTVAVFWYVSAVCRGRPARLWVGGLFTLAAFLIRPLAVVIPLAVLPALDWRTDRRATLGRSVLPLVAALAVMAVSLFVMSRTMGSASRAVQRMDALQWWFMVTAAEYVEWNAGLVLIATLPIAPLLVASLVRPRVAAAVALVSIALAAALRLTLGAIPSPIPDFQTWSLQDIGARAMIGGSVPPSAWSQQVAGFVNILGLVTVGALVVACRRLLRHVLSMRAGLVLVVLGLLNLVLINALWFYNDRYYLVLAPPLIYAAVSLSSGRRRETWIATGLLAVWAALAISGTRDMLDVNDASAAAARQLEASGVRPWDIDAGYSANGWRLYAHPENLPPGADRDYDVPFVTSLTPTTYKIANLPLPGYDVLRVIRLEHAWWQATDCLYVLRRQAG